MAVLKRRTAEFSVIFATALLTSSFVTPQAQAATETINVWVDSGNDDRPLLEALAKAFENANPSIHVVVDIGPAGIEAVNVVKDRLAAGTMEDAFIYCSGSLFQALDPTKNLVDLAKESWQGRVISSYFPAVSIGERKYGAPIGSAMGGGILYNKVVYRELGLKIPLTWSQFMMNNAKIKKAGKIPVIATYKDSWTAQMFVLADEFNVQAVSPNFPAMYTANKVDISKSPAALAGFQHLEEVHKAGYQNKDFASTTLADGLRYLALGKGVHYPMLSFAATDLEKKYPKLANNVGIFAQPGNSAKQNGLTIWMPNGLFISNTTKHLAAAKKFVAFSTTSAGIAAMTAAVKPIGPYLIKGAKLQGHISQIASEMLPYLNAEGRTAPALEFVSPIKGPNLSKITVQVGSGIKTAKEGALAYDADVKKESKRLGLPGWGGLPG